MGQQPGHHLGNEVALRLVVDERVQHHRVGAPVGVEQQVGVIVIRGDEVGRARGLHHLVVDVTPDRVDVGLVGRVAAEHLPQPRHRLQ